MAVITPTSRTFHNFGDMAAVTIVVAAATDGDTLVTGLHQVVWAGLTCNTLGTPISFGASWSGGTITFDTSADMKAFTVLAVGK
jgi:hypothetical protein